MGKIIQEYDEQYRNYSSFSNSLKSLIERFLLNAGVEVHTIATRVKDRKSLEKKIITKERYNKLSDITDIVGVRIITHYSDDVDKIARVIEKEFLVDKENSIDKRATLDPDRFGYLSLHYIVGLKKDRINLAEYSHFKDIKAEIQIRSILQHTWAEIEHDTGYKSNTGVPDAIRRKFSRLAGLLEIADDEFVEIKKKLERHKNKIEKDIKKGSDNIPLDKISLIEYLNRSDVIEKVIKTIQESSGYNLSGKVNDTHLTTILLHLDHFNINNLKDLDDSLRDNEEGIYKRFSHITKDIEKIEFTLPRQIIVSYLTQVLALKDGDIDKINRYVDVLKKNKIKHPNNYQDNLYETYTKHFK